MPHEYQFEWSAPFPNASTLLPLSKRLADLAVNRSKWFRTKHVLIPWGCDYMFQDANLTFSATDQLIATVNAHTSAWGAGYPAVMTQRPGMLFRHFDANNNGYLELNEAENALRFLCKNKSDGSKADPVNVVYPVDAYVEGELRLPKCDSGPRGASLHRSWWQSASASERQSAHRRSEDEECNRHQ